MKNSHLFPVLLLSAALMLNTSCKKEESCYSEALYESSKDQGCTTDCPGVTGCDGKIYCNACEAARKGIAVK